MNNQLRQFLLTLSSDFRKVLTQEFKGWVWWNTTCQTEQNNVYYYEPLYYEYHIRQQILLFVQCAIQMQCLLIGCVSTTTAFVILINAMNWLYLIYLFCMRFQLKLTGKVGLIKEQILLSIALYLEDSVCIQYQLTSFLIFNIFYYYLNWQCIQSLNIVPDAFLITTITAELLFQVFKSTSIFHSFGNFCTFFQNMYLIISFLVIIAIVKHFYQTVIAKLLENLEFLNLVVSKKDLYQAAMIHELRNPLNAVIGGIDLLSHSKCLSVEDKDHLEIIQHSASILESLIGSILDVAKLEANKMELDQQFVLVRQTFKGIIDLVEFKAKEKNLKLQYHIAHDVPDYIQMDQARFTQILLNLISNAVKFTMKGFVRVLVHYVPGQDMNGSPQNMYFKRNSAPENFNLDLQNELLQVTSHDSEDIIELSKRFKEQLSVKRSLLHISNSLFGDQHSNMPIRNHSSQSPRNFSNTLHSQEGAQLNNSEAGEGNNLSNQSQNLLLNDRRHSSPMNEPLIGYQMFGSMLGRHGPVQRISSKNVISDYIPINRDEDQMPQIPWLGAQSNHMPQRPTFERYAQDHWQDNEEEKFQFKKETTTENIYDDEIDEKIEEIYFRIHDPKVSTFLLRNNIDQSPNRQNFQYDDDEEEKIMLREDEAKFETTQQQFNSLTKQQNYSNGRTSTIHAIKHNFTSHDQPHLNENPRIIMGPGLENMNNDSLAIADQHRGQMHQQYSTILNIQRQENYISRNDEMHDTEIMLPFQQSISPSNQQDQRFILDRPVMLTQNSQTQQIQLQPQNTIENTEVQSPQPRPKSDNRLENFRKRNLLSVDTRRQQLQMQQASNIMRDITESSGMIMNTQSPMMSRHLSSNVPTILTDQQIINDNVKSGFLQVTIQDTGIGICEEDQKKLFNPFQQANKNIQKKFGGTGLGLWVCSKLVKLMKGKLTLKSAKDRGTTFFLRIPLDGISLPEHGGGDSQMSSGHKMIQLETNLNRLSILSLIQDELNKEVIRKFLIKLQCPVTFASDYDDFQDKLKFVHKFNVCIIDSDQFSLSQFSTIKKLTEYKKEIEMKTKKTLTLLVLSTLDLDARQRKKLEADRVIIFRKPVKQNTLKDCLQDIQKRERSLLPYLLLREQHKLKSMRLRKSGPIFPIGKNRDAEDNNSLLIAEEVKLHYEDNNPVTQSEKEKSKDNIRIDKMLLDGEGSIQTPVFKKNQTMSRGNMSKVDSKQSRFMSMDHSLQLNSNMNDEQSVKHRTSEGRNVGCDEIEYMKGHGSGIPHNSRIIIEPLENLTSNEANINGVSNETEKRLSLLLKASNNPVTIQKQDTFNHKCILIVDDQESNRDILIRLLSRLDLIQNYSILLMEAENGREAYECYINEPSNIQMILTDLCMPVMDGKESSTLIKEFEEKNNIESRVYIVGITGEDVSSQHFKRNYSFNNSGINEFLQKPVRLAMLEKIISQIYEYN